MQYFHIIYKLIFPNNKIYIGQTIDFDRRMNEYKNKSNNKKYNIVVYKAIRKYGWDNVKQEIMFTVPTEFVNELETVMIAEHNATNKKFGYNILEIGRSTIGFRHSEKTKNRIREQKIGISRSDEIRKKISKSLKGKYSNSDNPMFDVHRFGKDAPFYNKKHTEESKNKIGASSKGRKHSEESKEKQSKLITVYSKCGDFIKDFKSISKASVELKTGITSISNNLSNRSKTANGYIFKYNN